MNQAIDSDEEWVRKMIALVEGEPRQEEQELTDDEIIAQFAEGRGIFAADV